MIKPISNISFKNFQKNIKNKISQKNSALNPPLNAYLENSIYSSRQNINFCGYLSKSLKVPFEYGVENNFFKLPEITTQDGSTRQIKPDKSQLECARKLSNGKNVVFSAPTGIGKTAVAHFAMSKNLAEGKRTIYTVPIKALANDKYQEFTKIYGEDNVGILTGDRKINPDAPIVIMVCEIFDKQSQTMSANEALKIGTVIFDEAHYISDEERGLCWERAIMNAASKGIQILALSATIGNTSEFTKWIGRIPKARPAEFVEVKQNERPVPLVWHLYRRARNDNEKDRLLDITYGEVDLSSELDDGASEIIDTIYKAERDYYERRHQANLDKPEYNNEFLLDEGYLQTIAPKLWNTLGEDWVNADFSSDEVYLKLKDVFKSLAPLDMGKLHEIASKSGVNLLSNTQKIALEEIFRAEFSDDESYEMTDADYEYTYRQLRGVIGRGRNDYRYGLAPFKVRLQERFPNISGEKAQKIARLLMDSKTKKVNEIHENWRYDDFISLVEVLRSDKLLPAIIFKFAQGGCEEAAKSLASDKKDKKDKSKNKAKVKGEDNFKQEEMGEKQLKTIEKQSEKLDLLTPDEKRQVREILDRYKENGVYIGKDPQVNMLLRGWGVHHAGRLPQYKKLIEELFSKKLLKVVIATSTLGAGINMPAKTAVMTGTAYMKYDNEIKDYKYVPLSANEFHQATGRAGRRGLDDVGHVVFYNLHTPYDAFRKDELYNDEGKIDELWLAYSLLDEEADDVRSTFRPEFTSLAQYYSKNKNMDGLKDMIKISLKSHLAHQKDLDKIEKSMLKKFENYTQVLFKTGCAIKNYKDEIELTPKGEMLIYCQGMNPLLLASILYDEKLAKVTPIQLCQIAGHIQDSSERGETPSEKMLILDKLKMAEIGLKLPLSQKEFEIAKAAIETPQTKILRALNESRAVHTDIKTIGYFGGFAAYMFASLNEANADKSISNFEKVISMAKIALSSDKNANNYFERQATEGNVYEIITGAIANLKQIIRICDFALADSEKYPNTYYWETLKGKAIEAMKLLNLEPINNEPDYANKLSND